MKRLAFIMMALLLALMPAAAQNYRDSRYYNSRTCLLYTSGLSALQRHDEVFGIQHVQYRIDTVAVHLGHIAARSR